MLISVLLSLAVFLPVDVAAWATLLFPAYRRVGRGAISLCLSAHAAGLVLTGAAALALEGTILLASWWYGVEPIFRGLSTPAERVGAILIGWLGTSTIAGLFLCVRAEKAGRGTRSAGRGPTVS